MASKSIFGQNDQSARYAAASLALGLMFVSLVVIYLTAPQSDTVTFLCVVIMAVSLLIALIGNWNEIGMMAALATLTSLMAAYFLGRDVLSDVGSILFPLGWGGALLYIFRWISSHTVVVPEDHAIMVARFYSGTLYRLQPPLAPPLIPLLERRVATIPLYELSHDAKVTKINTGGSHSIDEVDVHLRYRVKNPEFALANIPNRGQIQNEVAREMRRDLEQARLDVAFWEKLLARQLAHEVDDIVREVIFAETKSATDAYQKRQHISREVFRRLNELTQRWGVVVTRVDIDYFSVPEDRFRSPDPDGPVKQEVKRILETSKAEAQAEAERIRNIVRVLREEGIEISPEIVGALLIPEWTSEIEALLPPPAAQPSSERAGNRGAKPGNAKQ
ncbi:MAG: SPFH domain-containing protein [Roseiflexus sp.]|nr:SPFH domain-containing protein [Roseiflexus sp.]MCS7290854.1 SPFH domain-containing protein [Roseiflexus sp.]MDW8146320.1 SPFH domain-containing protein [Roseiflexaceae bacterium]MDW8234067.1 SPFH domain-containing protein [Roseiflexaceae bacterium]